MWNPRSPQSQGPGGRSCSVHIVAGIPSQKLSPIERASFSVGHLWRLRIRVRVARAALVGFLMAFFLPGLGTPLVRAQNVGHRDFSYGKTGDAKLTAWAAPEVLPVGAAAEGLASNDISAVIAFQGNKIGVMWSNQVNGLFSFA